MERELTLELVRITEAAAMAAARWMGRGDKEAVDKAAVDMMRSMFDTVDIDGRIVIGEGERDEAPMLYIGERVGRAGENHPKVDIAVDPVEGTNLVAYGRPNALAVVAVAPEGGLLHAPDMYMDKIATGPGARGCIDLEAPLEDNVRRVAEALSKPVEQVTVVVLDRPRHEEIIATLRQLGVRIQLISDGDVAGAVSTALEETGVDLLVGTGGAPEGVLAAAALHCLGGEIQGRLKPRSQEETDRAASMLSGDIERVLTMEDLVSGSDVMFVATGITGGSMLQGVRFADRRTHTYSLAMRALTGTIRYVEASHVLDRKPVVKDLL